MRITSAVSNPHTVKSLLKDRTMKNPGHPTQEDDRAFSLLSNSQRIMSETNNPPSATREDSGKK
jgi:hypothetical protein